MNMPDPVEALDPDLNEAIPIAADKIINGAPTPDPIDPAPGVTVPDVNDAAKEGAGLLASLAERVEKAEELLGEVVGKLTVGVPSEPTHAASAEVTDIAQDVIPAMVDDPTDVPWTHRGFRKGV